MQPRVGQVLPKKFLQCEPRLGRYVSLQVLSSSCVFGALFILFLMAENPELYPVYPSALRGTNSERFIP